MKFPLGKDVVFISTEGEEVVARPFFFTDMKSPGVHMDLYSLDGTPIHLVDEQQGIYGLGETGVQLFLLRK